MLFQQKPKSTFHRHIEIDMTEVDKRQLQEKSVPGGGIIDKNESSPLQELVRQFCSIHPRGYVGCRKREYNPKMGLYSYYRKNVLDIVVSAQKIIIFEKWLSEWLTGELKEPQGANVSKEILWVETRRNLPGSKELLQELIAAKVSPECPFHYVTSRWIPGLMSNWAQVTEPKRKLLEEKEEPSYETKLSKRQKRKEMEAQLQLIKSFGGLKNLTAPPGLVIFSNLKSNLQAFAECKKKGISTLAMVDSDDDPTGVDIAIALNRNSMPAWTIFVDRLTQSIKKAVVKPRTPPGCSGAQQSSALT